MRYRLIIKSEAEIDILESAKWYEERRSKLGHRFLESVDNKLLPSRKPRWEPQFILYQPRAYDHVGFP